MRERRDSFADFGRRKILYSSASKQFEDFEDFDQRKIMYSCVPQQWKFTRTRQTRTRTKTQEELPF